MFIRATIILMLTFASAAWAQLEPVQDICTLRDDYWGREIYYDCNTLDMNIFMERVLYYAQVILPETEYIESKKQIYGKRQLSDFEEIVIQVIPYRSIRFQDNRTNYVSISIHIESWHQEKLQPDSYNIAYNKACDFIEEVISIAKSCAK